MWEEKKKQQKKGNTDVGKNNYMIKSNCTLIETTIKNLPS